MKLYEQLGLSYEGVEPTLTLKRVESCEKSIRDGSGELRVSLKFLADGKATAALRYYLIEEFQESRKFAEGSIPAIMDYLFGDWREKVQTDKKIIDPDWWHDKDSWMMFFSLGVFWSSVLGNWEAVKKLADYPDERRGLDVDMTPALRQIYLEIAEFVRSGCKVRIKSRASELKGANRGGTSLLAGCLERISARNADTEEAINEYFKHHHKRKRSTQVTDTVSVDGTFMVNLAQHCGLRVKLDPRIERYFVTFEGRV